MTEATIMVDSNNPRNWTLVSPHDPPPPTAIQALQKELEAARYAISHNLAVIGEMEEQLSNKRAYVAQQRRYQADLEAALAKLEAA